MAIEIERKFLLKNDSWRAGAVGSEICQGYAQLPNGVFRVRIYGDKAFLTVKGKLSGLARAEFEYEIPIDDARAMLETDLRRVLGIRRELKLMKRLKNHIVVCGHGRMGQAVVEVLDQRGLTFVVVDINPDHCRTLEDQGKHVVCGDATDENVLASTNIAKAKTIITCLADDAHNVYTILIARQLNPEVTVIARAVENGAEERLKLAGADRVLNPYKIGGMRLALTAIKPTVTDFIDESLLGSSVELDLAEIVIEPSSELAGKTLAGAEVRQRFGIIVVALKRGDLAIFNPDAHERIEGGDVLVALGPMSAIERVEKAVQ